MMAEEKGKNSRAYHILRETEQALTLAYVTLVEASNPEQAIRLIAANYGEGRYIAIPDRNWTPIGVRVEVVAPRIILDTDTAAVDEPEQHSVAVPPVGALRLTEDEDAETANDDTDRAAIRQRAAAEKQ
jgi:hypothetical protein